MITASGLGVGPTERLDIQLVDLTGSTVRVGVSGAASAGDRGTEAPIPSAEEAGPSGSAPMPFDNVMLGRKTILDIDKVG